MLGWLRNLLGGRSGGPSKIGGPGWEEVWDARADALAEVLGPSDDLILHSPVPFELGGQADVLAFSHRVDGVAYVTAELTGKPDACFADYELMICHRKPDDWGPSVISRLARYTQDAHIGSGETMDVDSATPAGSNITAFLFDTYATFTLFGREYELRLCIGITKPELQFNMANGSERLLELLKRHGVYPFTDLGRDSVQLDFESRPDGPPTSVLS